MFYLNYNFSSIGYNTFRIPPQRQSAIVYSRIFFKKWNLMCHVKI